jgi:CRP-like cAMP-binding protein
MEDLVFKNFSDTIKHFTVIDDKDVSEINSYCYVSKLKKNEFFLKEGQVCHKICFINTGILRHFYFTEQHEVTRWITMENEFTTSLQSFIMEVPSVENLQAITDCELVIFDRKAFKYLLDNNTGFKNLWIKALEYNYLTAENRVFSLIKKSAEERFEWMMKNQPRFILQIPVMYTASMLGITTRHLSRLRKKYKI